MYLLLLLICGFNFATSEKLKTVYNVSDLEYDLMPKLFHLDDFDECMNLESNLYCYVNFQLEPNDGNNYSKTWQIIQEVISIPRSYRHDKLRHGICILKTCPQIPSNYVNVKNPSKELLLNEMSKCYTEKYSTLGLKATAEKAKCQDRNNPLYEIDGADWNYGILITIILATVILATIYDRNAPLNKTNTYSKLLISFSITRNWERLTSDSASPDAAYFAPIQGVRTYNTLLVVMSHTVMLMMLGPVHNPRYVEETTLKTENMFISNGSLICQTFFLISGWFLSYNFCVVFEGKRVQVRHLVYAFVNRYLRLVPVLLLAIGFSATWLRHLGDGPVWHHFVEDEFKNCRKNWFANILFINNYYKHEEMCIQQSWYLSVDTQCFILGLFIMMLVLNKPEAAKKIFGFFIISGIVITFAHHYYNDYDIVFRSYPETLYTIYLQHNQWLNAFIAGHVAIPCYVQGLAFGYYFYKLKKANKSFLESNFAIFIWHLIVWVGSISAILYAGQFYKNGAEYTRLHAAIYQSINRYFFGISIGIGIFGMTMGVGKYMRAAVICSPLQVLARISFSTYLSHVWLMRVKYGTMRQPIYVTDLQIVFNTFGDIATSIILGTLICLITEMPLSAIQKVLLTSNNFKDEKQKGSKKKL